MTPLVIVLRTILKDVLRKRAPHEDEPAIEVDIPRLQRAELARSEPLIECQDEGGAHPVTAVLHHLLHLFARR